jgi:murein DD-endopeptidase MepM/ murein hydrolase activator NlpD
MRHRGALALVTCLLIGAAAPAAADLNSDLSDVRNRIQVLRGQAGETRSARTDAANALLDAAAELEDAAGVLAEAEALLASTDTEIAAAETVIADLRVRISYREATLAAVRSQQANLLEKVQQRVVEMYMSASETARLPLLESDVEVARVGVAYAYRIQEAADLDLHNYEALEFQASGELRILADERTSLEETVAALEERRAEQDAQREIVAAQAQVVRQQVAAQQAELDRIEREIAAIDGEIASLAREEGRIRAVLADEQSGSGSAPAILIRPVPGAVTSGYGYRTHPIYGDQRLHTGWDMTAGCGVPIKSGASGRVILSGWYGGYGNTIIVDHGGGMATLYAHQSSLGASYNQQVSAGQTVGWVGTTGLSTGCHLHYEVRINGNPVDPTPYM